MRERQMEFFVLSYVPKIGGASQINVGVILFERIGNRIAFAQARFVRDIQQLLAFESDADPDMLQSLFRDIEKRLDNPEDRKAVLHTMQDTFSNMLQVSDTKAILVSDDPSTDVETLASLYLVSP